jgi:phenylalanyl-tRNA synthetase beta chain
LKISYEHQLQLVERFIETNLSPQELAAKLTSVGLAVEGIHEAGDDFVFDVDVTSNRGDCLSHLGVAREVAVITNSQLRITNYEEQQSASENQTLISIQDADLCHRFTARVIRNVKNRRFARMAGETARSGRRAFDK